MSIGPVGSSVPASGPQSLELNVRATPRPSPTSESEPSREESAQKNTAPVPSVPQDEVRVQQDTPADYIMIYQFVNQQSGSLILQMPDEQVLSIVHEIQQMLQSTQREASMALGTPEKSAGE